MKWEVGLVRCWVGHGKWYNMNLKDVTILGLSSSIRLLQQSDIDRVVYNQKKFTSHISRSLRSESQHGQVPVRAFFFQITDCQLFL